MFVPKVAYIILCHRDPLQVIQLVERLANEQSFFVIHIDKKANATVVDTLRDYSANSSSHIILSKRCRCYWGSFGIVQATIYCIDEAINFGVPFDYLFLLSGQDYPLKDGSSIRSFLSSNLGKEFIESFRLDEPNRWSGNAGYFNAMKRIQCLTFFIRSRRIQFRWRRKFLPGLRPYGGSQWWCLSKECVLYAYRFIQMNPRFVRYFKTVFIPDESFFQSIVSNSPFRDRVVSDDLRYTDWENPNPNHPRTLDDDDFEKLLSTDKLFGRKFESNRSKQLLKKLDAEFFKVKPSSDQLR